MFKNTRKEKNFKYMEQELVAGSVESVSKLTMQDVLDFKNTYFSIENVIVSVVGNVKFSQVKNACKKYCSLPGRKRTLPESATAFKGGEAGTQGFRAVCGLPAHYRRR